MIPIARALCLSAPLSLVLIVDGPIAWVVGAVIWLGACWDIAAVAGMNRGTNQSKGTQA